jgi:hypothetical protein
VELVESGRILWRRRRFVLGALALSAIAGVLLSFRVTSLLPPHLHKRTYTVGEASGQVLIDTSRSQIGDISPAGEDALYPRAALLSNLMATAPVERNIAKLLKLPPGDLSIKPPAESIVAPIKATPLAVAGGAASGAHATWALSITLDPNLPLINFAASAPTPQQADALATAAITVLRQQVSSVAIFDGIPYNDQVIVNTIGPPVATLAVRGIRALYGAVAAAVLFLVLCMLIVLLGSAVETHRRREAARGIQVEAREPTPTPTRPRPSIATAEHAAPASPADGHAQVRLG